MSAPPKRNKNEKLEKAKGESDSDSEESSDEEYKGNEEIQVDFEGRSPVDSDFHGIKQLLQQLFLRTHINLSELVDVIISQNHVGSVVKQCDDEPADEDDDGIDVDDVYGITSVINLTDKKDKECIVNLRKYLEESCKKHGSEQAISSLSQLFQTDDRHVGLIINERFVNIPPQIAVPLLDSLNKEIERAKKRKLPFNFQYYIMICKLHKAEKNNKAKKGKKKSTNVESDILWVNAEEEAFEQFAEFSFEFSVKDISDSGLVGHWRENDLEMTPWRKVLVLPASKMNDAILKVSSMLQE